MTCNACGEKPKDTAKDFTKAVVEINNPETLVLLRKVVVPASMGTEEDVPAAIGKYHNVILHYEANKHTYLYSSDGIPTLLEMEVPQELLDRIEELEENLAQETDTREDADEELQANIDAVAQDLEDFKNSPDVVDIVPTYAALQAYDTSSLSNNDEIRVLADETRDGASAYYRWDKTNSQWIFIGITGPYYTKSEIDTTVSRIEDEIDNIDIPDVVQTSGTSTEDVMSQKATTDFVNKVVSDNIGISRTLTSNDYNWNSTTHSATEPYNCVALWLLPPGMYTVDTAPVAKYANPGSPGTEVFASANDTYIIGQTNSFGRQVIQLVTSTTTTSGYSPFRAFCITPLAGHFNSYLDLTLYKTQDTLDSLSTVAPLSAYQGQVLNTRIGDLSALTTTDKTSAVSAINELASKTVSVVQTTGASTTDVMSQNAISSLIFGNISSQDRVHLGGGSGSAGDYTISIGRSSSVSGSNATAVGASAHVYNGEATALGSLAYAGADSSVALGYGAKTTKKGEVNIGTSNATYPNNYGYNRSSYRLLTGLYDPQSDHDAATKGYVDTSVSAIGAGTRMASATGWDTSAPLDYVLARNTQTDAQGAMFLAGDNLADFPFYVGIGVNADETPDTLGPRPYLLTQQVSDDGQGETSGNPGAQRIALHGELQRTIINGGTTAPTTTTVGEVGTQYTYVDTSGTPTAHLCVCVAVDTSVTPNTYTWQTLI